MAGPVRFYGLPPVRVPAEQRVPGEVGAEAPAVQAPHDKPFLSYLQAQVGNVNRLQQEADATVAAVATGQSNNLHEMMIALDKADVSFRMLTRVRNKVIDAYQEIMRMSV
jgi:flagellar hook-basal body complex protein FliE